MPSDVIRGVDYLIDYYAMLGVDRDAPLEVIEAAFRVIIKQYHPDRLHGLAPEFIRAAERKSRYLTEAVELFRNENARREYDEKLADWTKPLSQSGEAVIDLMASGFSFSSLVGHMNADAAVIEAEAEKMSLQFSGFKQATYDFFKALADSPSGIPDNLRAAYREQLEQRNQYLAFREGYLMDTIGEKNHSETPEIEYRAQSAKAIEGAKASALGEAKEQVLRLSRGEVALIAPPEGYDPAKDSEKLLSTLETMLETHFEKQKKLLEPVAAEREEVITKRFTLLSEITYHPLTTSYTDKVVVEIKLDKVDEAGKSKWMALKVTGKDVTSLRDNGIEETLDPEIARQWIERGYTILSFYAVPETDFMSQLSRVMDLHYEKMRTHGTK